MIELGPGAIVAAVAQPALELRATRTRISSEPVRAGERLDEVSRRDRLGVQVAELAQLLDRLTQVPELLLVAEGVARGARRPPQELRALRAVRRDLERLLGEDERLVRRAERRRPLGRLPEPVARPGGERVGVGPLGGGAERLDVVRGDHARQLVVAGRLEVVRGREVPAPAVGLRQHPVGDLADDALDERVLARARASAGPPRRRGTPCGSGRSSRGSRDAGVVAGDGRRGRRA